jgi:hypothetical protein
MPHAFDRFMVHVGIGTDAKMRRLTPEQRWTFVAGVLALAAEGRPRGMLAVAGEPLTADDVAARASVTRDVAEETLARLRALGVVEQHGEVERLTRWEDYNPPAKPSDSREAARERQRRSRQRRKDAVSPQLGFGGTALRAVKGGRLEERAAGRRRQKEAWVREHVPDLREYEALRALERLEMMGSPVTRDAVLGIARRLAS